MAQKKLSILICAACKLRCWMGFSGKFGIDSIKVKMKLLNENMEKMGETAYKKAIKAAEEIAGLFCVLDKVLLTISYIFEQMKEVTPLALQKTIRSSAAEYLTYVASVGDQQDSIEMRYEDENIWLTQKMMATLYDVDVRTINEHIKRIYSDSELEEDSTIRNFRIVQTEGSRQVTRNIKHYNLQMIIAVGFKVNSERAVQFRKWVNQIAKDYTIKGWVMDDERLKNTA